DRLELQNEIVRHLFDGRRFQTGQETLFAAPDPGRAPPAVLDIGCGPGTWARGVATEFPRTVVVAVDIEAEFATRRADDPANLQRVQCDVLSGLPFADATFDLVRQGCMVHAVGRARWPELMAELRRVTKPGGFVELVEPYWPTAPRGPATKTMVAMS
ncbi:hypothetical protein HK405_000276, partial [Cladochytrium tenue]